MTALPSNVSRETLGDLEKFADLLLTWNARINLIGKATESTVWERHIADSLQLLPLAPQGALRWLDLGSGAGLPGIVVAIAWKAENPGGQVALIESDGRKCAFLREAIRSLDLPAKVLNVRIETVHIDPPDVISARALAPLADLLAFSQPLAGPRTCLLFPKGRRLDSELTEAEAAWHIDATRYPSATDPDGAILKIEGFSRK